MADLMQFRGFFFPHNPASITVAGGGRTAVHFCPGKGEVTQKLGEKGRIVTCRGCFLGNSFEEANRWLSEFLSYVKEDEPGSLFLPGCEPFLAHLVEITTEESGDGRVIPYVMVFREAEAGV